MREDDLDLVRQLLRVARLERDLRRRKLLEADDEDP